MRTIARAPPALSHHTDVTQRFTYGACGMHVHTVGDDGTAQRRSYPTWRGGDSFQAGYERVAARNRLMMSKRL